MSKGQWEMEEYWGIDEEISARALHCDKTNSNSMVNFDCTIKSKHLNKTTPFSPTYNVCFIKSRENEC